MISAEFIDFQWEDYEGLSMEDRFTILETYLTKNKNLFESNDPGVVSTFNNLQRHAISNPVENNKYIMVILALVNNEMRVFNNTQIVEYISKNNNEYKVKLQDGTVTTYPNKGLLGNLVINTFLFDNIENYDKFRVEIIMFFDRGLPEFKEEDLMNNVKEEYQQIIPPPNLKGRWIVTYIPKGENKAINSHYPTYDSAVKGQTELKRSGNRIIRDFPIQVSEESPTVSKWKTLRPNELRGSYTDQQLQQLGFKQNPNTKQWYILKTLWDELVKNKKISEAINSSNSIKDGEKVSAYFISQKQPDNTWKRVAKYMDRGTAEDAMNDLISSYQENNQEPPKLKVEMVLNYPKMMYESPPKWQKHQSPEQRIGVKNWHEIDRAYRQVNIKNPNDPLRLATLKFSDNNSRILKRDEVESIWKFLKEFFRDPSNQTRQNELYGALSTNRGIDIMLQLASRSQINEGKKRKSTRKSTRKTKPLPRVYGGWWGFGGDIGYSGDGGGEAAMEAKDEPHNKPQEPKEEPKVQLPPAHHAQKTQIPGTLPTYQKAFAMLNDWAPQGTTLDFGAGLGIGAKYMGSDTFEPFPRPGFQPTYTDSGSIKDNSYNRVTNLNVLNVVPKDTRDNIVNEIGRILAPGGVAIITTRGKDVMGAKGEKGSEPMSIITSIGTYQKGFSKAELKGYIENILGKGFEVESVNLGPAGVAIRKLAAPLKKRRG